MRTELVTDALDMADRNHALTQGCIIHSGREYVEAGGLGLPDTHSDGRSKRSLAG
jgi:hypothetical protein